MRELYVARLNRKVLLSKAAQCYHFEFTFTGDSAPPALQAGQFLSLLAEDASGKTYTRAYSVASAPSSEESPARTFDLCVNRVEGGFFSNLLCDMREGETVSCHGPHGLFTLSTAADCLFIAASTGIAPIRGFAQWLFPAQVPDRGKHDSKDRTQGCDYWLLYEARSPEELFYNSYFEELAASHASFHYVPVLGSDDDHEELKDQIARITQGKLAIPDWAVHAPVVPHAPTQRATQPEQEYQRRAYICGLSDVVKAARAQLLSLGWQKPQILFERYD